MVVPPKPVAISAAQAVDLYLDAMAARVAVGGLAATTVENYRADLTEFVQHVTPEVLVDDIDGPLVDKALTLYATTPDRRFTQGRGAGKGRSPATQARFKQSVDKFFRHAERQAWVQVSPMPWVTLDPRPRGGLRVERTSLNFGQAEALLRYGAGEPEGPAARPHERNYLRDRFLLAALTVLGPRVSEVCRARDDDFTWIAGEDGVEVEHWRIVGKGGKVRVIPMSPWLSGLKADYLQVRPSPVSGLSPTARQEAATATWRTGHGGALDSRDVQRLLPRAADRVRQHEPARARGITPHALRHTAATLMLASGWDVKVVAQMLGHASIATTGIYLDELPGELARAVAAHPLAVTANH